MGGITAVAYGIGVHLVEKVPDKKTVNKLISCQVLVFLSTVHFSANRIVLAAEKDPDLILITNTPVCFTF